MMLGPIIDTILGLFFVFALFGLINSIIVETLPRLLSVFGESKITRARMLQLTVHRLLGGTGNSGKGGLGAYIYSHPLISINDGKNQRIPSYIDPAVFGDALADVLINRGHWLAKTLNAKAAVGVDATKKFIEEIKPTDPSNPLSNLYTNLSELVARASSGTPSQSVFIQRIEQQSRMLPRLSDVFIELLIAKKLKLIPLALNTLSAGACLEWKGIYVEIQDLLATALGVTANELTNPDSPNLNKLQNDDKKINSAIDKLQEFESLTGHLAKVADLTFETLKDSIDALPDYCGSFKQSMRLLVWRAESKAANAEKLMTEFYTEANGWLDRGTDRISGWYKRQARTIGLVSAVVLSGAANVDTINLLNTLSSNPAIREKVATLAITAAQQWEKSGSDPITAKYETDDCKSIRENLRKWDEYRQFKSKWDEVKQHKPDEVPPQQPEALSTKQLQMVLVCPEATTQKAIAEFNSSGLPIGWTDKQWKSMWDDKENKWWILAKWLLGIFISALAITLGGEFWFKQIQEIVRLTGRTPAKQSQ